MDDALVISGVFPKKSSTIVENEEWEWGAYSGDWVDGCPDGRGIWRWPDGQVYEEDSLNNGQNEKGIDTLPQLDLMSMAGWVG